MTTTIPAVIEVQTTSATQVVDITEQVRAHVAGRAGACCHLYLRHTTAGLMIVTGETGVPEDLMAEPLAGEAREILHTLTPARAYRHDSPAHVAAHFLSALVGPSVSVPVRDGALALGELQRIALMEKAGLGAAEGELSYMFEGPRRREIEVRLLAEA